MADRRLAFTAVFLALACAHPQSSEAAPARATLTYLGVAGWQLQAGEHTLLVDPYFTRANVEDDKKPLLPDQAAIARFAPAKAEAILIGHSHYDHLLDAPMIALRTKASIVGTESTAHVAIASGVPRERVFAAKGGEAYTFGPFSVRAIRGLHSLTGQPDLPIPENVTTPMAARDYNQGGTLQYLVAAAGHQIVFIGTANFVDENLAKEKIHADVAVIATGLREKIPGYSCRLMELLGHPALVLTNHFDSFRKPLVPGQMELDEDTRKDLQAFTAEVHGCSPETRVLVPTCLDAIDL